MVYNTSLPLSYRKNCLPEDGNDFSHSASSEQTASTCVSTCVSDGSPLSLNHSCCLVTSNPSNSAKTLSKDLQCPGISPYDVVEMKVTSLHQLERDRESVRIIGVAAGENLHNIYRVIMSSLNQREDRARLILHAWVLPDGRIYGNGPKYKDAFSDMENDRELFLNDLPITVGYSMQLIFGKCVYNVNIEDIFSELTDEQDLIWTPRICEGSYGEAIPFDLCFSPHLFRNVNDGYSSLDENLLHSLKHLMPVFDSNHYLSSAEIDELNKNLSKMRFIRQYSKLKPSVRKNRPEDYILNEEKRKVFFRMPPRKFFFFFWSFRFIEHRSFISSMTKQDPQKQVKYRTEFSLPQISLPNSFPEFSGLKKGYRNIITAPLLESRDSVMPNNGNFFESMNSSHLSILDDPDMLNYRLSAEDSPRHLTGYPRCRVSRRLSFFTADHMDEEKNNEDSSSSDSDISNISFNET